MLQVPRCRPAPTLPSAPSEAPSSRADRFVLKVLGGRCSARRRKDRHDGKSGVNTRPMTSSHTQVAGAPSASEEGVDDMKPSSYSLIWFVLMRAIVMVGLVFYCKLIDRRHAAEAQEAILAYRAAMQAQIRGLSGREATAEDETEECSICLTAFGKGGDMAVLPCAHAFHRECISCWLLRAAESGTAMTCPLCKAPPFPNAMPLAASTLSHEQQRPNDETNLSPEALEAGSMAAPPPRGITTLAMV